MKVLIVEPGKYPREADIEHTLEAEQAVVGGTIEAVYPWRDSACIVCNDNGIAENLPLNRMLGDYDIIHGTFFVCGLTSNDFTDLTPQQMKRYEELYHDPQLFFAAGQDPVRGTHHAGRIYPRYGSAAQNKRIPGALI